MQSLKPNIALRRTFRLVFWIAPGTHPTLGTDVLSFFNLNMKVKNRRLMDNTTILMVNGFGSRSVLIWIRALLPKSDYCSTLDEFPAITRPYSLVAPVQHRVYHWIETAKASRFRMTSSTLWRAPVSCKT